MFFMNKYGKHTRSAVRVCFCLLFLINIFYNLQHMLCLLRGELFQFQEQFSGDLGGGSILVEKLLGRNAEKFTYIKKACERGKRPPVFDFVDVAFALAQGETHVPGRYTFLHPQLRQPGVKPFDLIQNATSFSCI